MRHLAAAFTNGPPAEMPAPEILNFAFALWLGLYLITRDPSNPRLRFTGLGLAAYAAGLAFNTLSPFAPEADLALRLIRLGQPLLALSGLFWLGATPYLLTPEHPSYGRLARAWQKGLLVVAGGTYLVSVGTDLVFNTTTGSLSAGPAYPVFAGVALLPPVLSLALIGRGFLEGRQKLPFGVLLTVTVFLALGIGMLILPFGWLPRAAVVLAVGLDLILLGLAIAALDAFDEGEALLPDFLRSLSIALVTVVLFGGQIALVMVFATGVSLLMLVLLLATVAAAVGLQTFADPLHTALESLIFARWPRLREARAELRAVAGALPRVNESLDLEAVSEEEFVRLTRRALSHLGNLPRLAASPLTRLPLIQRRLAARGVTDNTLDRAAELKAVLTESIERLRPREGRFGTSDEWRHFNALYFPYVLGLKPYSRRGNREAPDPEAQAVLEWFRAYVPERTLYNWQNAAARLVAQDLRERSKGGGSEAQGPRQPDS